MKIALITGITGQTGSYLAEYLLSFGYEVHGIVRRSSSPNHWRIASFADRLQLHTADITDLPSLTGVLEKCQPNEVYNLAAQSFVPASWDAPLHTAEVNAVGVAVILEAIRRVNKGIAFYQASTSEMFGRAIAPQSESTPFHPRSPYSCSKVFAHHLTVNYRESYGMYAVSGICFNHESPRRGLEFVTRKITHAVAMIACKRQDKLALGNLDARRDWGFAGDYVRAMRLMLQQPTAQDYVVGTGETHSVGEFVRTAFEHAGISDWQQHVVTDKNLIRPAEVDVLRADASKIRALGWLPTVSFRELVAMMVDADLAIANRSGW